MSDLNPRGVQVEVCGEQRSLLFTLNAIDAVQSELDMPVLEALDIMLNDRAKQPKFVKTMLKILLDSEADRVKLQTGQDLRRFSEEEIGMLIGMDNVLDIIVVIFKAYGISMPESSEEETDPN